MRKFNPAPPISEKTVISIRIDTDVLEEIDKTANELKLSRNELLVQCIDFALDNLEFDDSANNR